MDAQWGRAPWWVDLRLGGPGHRGHQRDDGGDVRGVLQDHLDPIAADGALEAGGRVIGHGAAAVDHRDPVGQLVGLVEVVRGEEHRGAAGSQLADGVPDLAAAARVEAGGGLVEEEHLGREDHARGQVEPAAHPAAEGLGLLVRGVDQAELLQQLLGPPLRAAAVEVEQPGEQPRN